MKTHIVFLGLVLLYLLAGLGGIVVLCKLHHADGCPVYEQSSGISNSQ
jgi:hypothetical protein